MTDGVEQVLSGCERADAFRWERREGTTTPLIKAATDLRVALTEHCGGRNVRTPAFAGLRATQFSTFSSVSTQSEYSAPAWLASFRTISVSTGSFTDSKGNLYLRAGNHFGG